MSQSTTRVQVINSAGVGFGGAELCFQWCRYLYGDGSFDYGYRFIWKNKKLLAHRGQARIPSVEVMNQLVKIAKQEGWGDYDGTETPTYPHTKQTKKTTPIQKSV